VTDKGVDRRKLGRYDTPRRLAQAIANWAIRHSTDEILEPSSGSGVFVQSALARLTRLGNPNSKKQVWACDVDPNALSQTICNTGLHPFRAWQADFLSLVDDKGAMGRRFTCVIGNPPYISLHRMPMRQRTRARKTIARLGAKLDFKASLWAYFVIAASRSLRENGRMAMILPETALHAEYARELLTQIARRFALCRLVSMRERCFLNDGTAERVVILLADSYQATETKGNIEMRECQDISETRSFLKEAIASQLTPALPQLNGHAVPYLLREGCVLDVDLARAPESRRLGDIATVKIGVVTGANDFFLLSEPERKHWRLPASAVVRLLPRFLHCTGLFFGAEDWRQIRTAGKQCWLLRPKANENRKTVLRYLANYRKTDREKNVTFNKREPWYRVEMGQSAHAFLRYMGALSPRMALSRGYATCTNTIHRVYFKKGISKLQRQAIAISLHSSFTQLSAEFEGRAYGLGVLKLEPSEASRLRFLLPGDLTTSEVKERFAEVEQALRGGNRLSATAIADDWLYRCIPQLSEKLPLKSVRKTLSAAIDRRIGAVITMRKKSTNQ
jgi:tRNA1(Val) A37 N6-methylase TrmN6